MLSFLFPTHCIGCWSRGQYLCDECLKELDTHSEICPYCHRFSQQGMTCRDCRQSHPDGLDGLIIGFRYHDSIKKAILKLKYSHISSLAPTLAHQLGLHLISHPWYSRMGDILLTDVPNHWRRRRMVKGYNQSTLLAHALSTEYRLPFQSLARRIKNTKQQTTLSKGKRWENLTDAFSSQTYDIKNYQTIVIVDDVTTTGSTLHHVCQSIKKQYPDKRVRWLVIARQGK